VIATPHASHAELAAAALRSGKHVYCEKPLAIDDEQLQLVEQAAANSSGVLFVGFNRRWAAMLKAVSEHISSIRPEPIVITYRVNAGDVPPGHWYEDPRQGGRLVGEVCHFIDTCAAIAGERACEVHAFSSRPVAAADADFVVSLKYPNGCIATVSYATGGNPRVAKEWIEVHGRRRSAVIVDFQKLFLDGRRVRGAPRDKGHVAALRAFRDAIASGELGPNSGLETTHTVMDAVASLTASRLRDR
jgi:predicted dehydrogenase